VAAIFALLLPANADAHGGSYTFSGGSEAAQSEARNALEASAFDWGLVPETVTLQIIDCGCAGARPGVVVLDETLLEATPYGRAYTWGIVQHEYAHQVWWFALDDEQGGVLQDTLGGADPATNGRGSLTTIMRASASQAPSLGRTGRSATIWLARRSRWADAASVH